jgi:hypothetical protein
MQGEPCGDECCEDEEEAEISKAAVCFFELGDPVLSGLSAALIFGGWIGGGRVHRRIIAQG